MTQMPSCTPLSWSASRMVVLGELEGVREREGVPVRVAVELWKALALPVAPELELPPREALALAEPDWEGEAPAVPEAPARELEASMEGLLLPEAQRPLLLALALPL